MFPSEYCWTCAHATRELRRCSHRPGNYVGVSTVYVSEMKDKGREAARRLASMRRTYKKVCPVCGTEFEGIARRVYDKPACQVNAYRQRKKGRG